MIVRKEHPCTRDTLLFMNEYKPSLIKFQNQLKKQGELIYTDKALRNEFKNIPSISDILIKFKLHYSSTSDSY